MSKFEITEELLDKCLKAAVANCQEVKDCIDDPVFIDDVGFCWDGFTNYAIVAEPVEDFIESKERLAGLRKKIEDKAPEYLENHDNLGPIVFVDAQVQILGPSRGFLRMHYNF